MSPALWITLVATLLSCFFAACNIALKTFSRAKLTDLFGSGRHGDRVDFVVANSHKLQLMTAFGRTIATFVVLLSLLDLVQSEAIRHSRLVEYLMAFGLAAVLVSVFAVAIPTSWARYHPERIVFWFYWPLLYGLWLFKPIADFLHLFDPLIRRISGISVDPEAPPEVRDDVMSVVEEHVEEGAVDTAQKNMLQAVLELPSQTAGEVMTPRTDIQGLDVSATIEEVKNTIFEQGHSRIPVYEQSIDHIVGILYAKDLIRFIGTDDPYDLRSLVREAIMVPESKSVRELLAEFKAKKVHIAIVIDEYGGTAGLVTIEDIIEELVGEISDEYEPGQPAPPVRRIDARTFEADARARVDQLNRDLELGLPESTDYDTIAGFVLSALGRIPAAGESVTHGPVKVTVLDAQRHKVNRLRIERLETEPSPTGGGGALSRRTFPLAVSLGPANPTGLPSVQSRHMDIRFYNTLTHCVEPFAPIDPPNVYMYNCGPTVYDYAHIGNFRTFIFADLVRRFLELTGHTVHQVMNITDVGHMTDDSSLDGGGEDKMDRARKRLLEDKKSGKLPAGVELDPSDPYQIARYYTDAFIADARALRLRIADEYPSHMPRATQYVPQMQELIGKLISTGHAYVAPDHAVYFDVQSFPDYGKLSGNTLDKLRTGAGGRVSQENQAVKKHPADFLLWKSDASHLMKWDSPWGAGTPGYPGWHIECSAMARQVLGQLASKGTASGGLEEIDIHTGGEDNIFPHHECEIAQSRGASGKPYFARFWMHARFLLVEGQKMSKSKGNFFTVRDVIEGKATGRAVDPAVLRFELLRAPYRENANFTARGLQDSAAGVQRLRDLSARLEAVTPAPPEEAKAHPAVAAFAAALADDLNIAAALAELFKWLGASPEVSPLSKAVLLQFDSVLGVANAPATRPDAAGDDGSVKAAALDAARKAKDFATADRLRKELIDAGYDVQTTKAGTVARKKLA